MKNLLVIDDTLFYQKLLQSVSEKFGYNVICSDGSDNIMSMIEKYNPLLVIIDMHLKSGIQGIDIIRYIRAKGKYDEIKIIAISAHVTKLKEVELEELSCISLSKPLEMNKLYELISA